MPVKFLQRCQARRRSGTGFDAIGGPDGVSIRDGGDVFFSICWRLSLLRWLCWQNQIDILLRVPRGCSMNVNLPVSRPVETKSSLTQGFALHLRVIGAIMLRELHTRYGRENIGYLWVIGEPLMLGSVIALLHSGYPSHGTIHPVAMTTVGYTIFIIFRGIVNRAEGTLHGNLPLMYHKMVSIFDIAFARAVLELAGCFMSFIILISLIVSLGYTDLPPRPLMLIAGIAYVFFFSFGIALIIVGGTHDNRLLERLVHPFTYFMIPLSGAFFQIDWIPEPYRGYLLYNPLPQMFELVRYGAFETATPKYVNFTYITAWCLVLVLLGLIALRAVKRRLHLT
ncbi:MAG: ABC transporter permease [Rickettsiales bacterium]|nr:ABC transporter permease [Rickettsiales bacterium]